MKWSTKVAFGFFMCAAALIGKVMAKPASPNPSFAQMIIPFSGERPFEHEWIKGENSLVLSFPSSSPSELEAINNYDERLVRRVLIKDLGPLGSEVRLVLRDKDVRAVVTTFKDPFRIAIDLFDKSYTEHKDPEQVFQSPPVHRPQITSNAQTTIN